MTPIDRRLVRKICMAAAVASCLVALPAAAQYAMPAPRSDGVRFRGGISLGGGGAFVAGWNLGMVGVDGRLGVQINNLIGVYAQPYFQLGTGSRNNLTGFTGFAGGSVMVDFTLFDRFFLGAGGGGAILNNPAAGELHFRLGGYPVMGRGLNGIRRKGLMLGVDLRVYFVEGGIGQVIDVMGGIGYEAY
jgi:hypothetical protein